MISTPRWMPFCLRRNADGIWNLKLYWLNVFKCILVCLVFGWIFVALGLYLHFKFSKDYEVVSFSKMIALPFRLPEHRKEMGEYHIQKSYELLQQQDYHKGITLLRLGVIRSPKNLDARRDLAFIYIHSLKRPDLGNKLLVDGLIHASESADYFSQTIQLLLVQKQYDLLKNVAHRYLNQVSNKVRPLLVAALACVYNQESHFNKTITLADSENLDETAEGVYYHAQALVALNEIHQAIQLLNEQLKKFPEDGLLLGQLAFLYQQIGDADLAKKTALLRVIGNPLVPEPQIDLIHVLQLNQDFEGVFRNARKFIVNYKNDVNALKMLVNFAFKTSNSSLSYELYETALENQHSPDVFFLTYAHILLKKGEYKPAINILLDLEKENPSWISLWSGEINALRALAYFGVNNKSLTQLYLEHAIESVGLSQPQKLLAIARQFFELGGFNEAYKLTEVLIPKYPPALKLHLQLQVQLDQPKDILNNIQRYVTNSKPEMAVLIHLYSYLAQDKFLFDSRRDDVLRNLLAYK